MRRMGGWDQTIQHLKKIFPVSRTNNLTLKGQSHDPFNFVAGHTAFRIMFRLPHVNKN
jgi:hypothetical protein